MAVAIDDYFTFEINSAWQIKALPDGISFKELSVLHNAVCKRHLEHCDAAIATSWLTGNHLSFDWNNYPTVEGLADELRELLKPLPYIKHVGLGMYHGNTIVFTVDYTTSEISHDKVLWFYKGFTIKHLFPQMTSERAD